MKKIISVKPHGEYGALNFTYDDGKVVRFHPEAFRNILQSFTYLRTVIQSLDLTDEEKQKAVYSFIYTHALIQDMGFGALNTVTADDQSMSLFCRESDPSGESVAFVFALIAHFRHGPDYKPVAGEFSTHS